MKNKIILYEYCFIVLSYLLVTYSALHFPQDPDLGWHLKYGEHFFKTGQILRENTFSNLMSGYHWVNTSWGIDLITYFIFSNFGFLGLMIAGGIVATLTFYFFSKAFKLSATEQALIFPVLMFLEYPLFKESFKGQAVSILFLSIQIFLLEKYLDKDLKRLTIFLGLLYLLWANIHAQFILGLGVLIAFIALRILYQKNPNLSKRIVGILLTLLGVLAITLINPYGADIYSESFKLIGNPKLKELIEYNPIYISNRLFTGHVIAGFIILASVAMDYAFKSFSKNTPYTLVSTGLYSLAFFVRRYAWSGYYFLIPLTKSLVSPFIPSNANNRTRLIISSLFLQAIILLAINNPNKLFSNITWDRYCQIRTCSSGATEFIIKNNLNTSKVFTIYSWSGYLIWNYPQIKPPVDGRMLLWKDESGYSGYDYYNSILLGQTDIDKTDYGVALVNRSRIYKRMSQLEKEGKWELVYSDRDAFVFVRKQN